MFTTGTAVLDRLTGFVAGQMPVPPLYTTPNEAGLGSPAVVNDVVLVPPSKPGLYALDADTGLCLWSATGLSGTYVLGPAV